MPQAMAATAMKAVIAAPMRAPPSPVKLRAIITTVAADVAATGPPKVAEMPTKAYRASAGPEDRRVKGVSRVTHESW